MKKKVIKIVSLLALSFLLCFATYKFCYFIAEKYLFDKFFYEKSIAHGYFPPEKNIQYADFGDRSKDIIVLYNHQLISNPKVYNITVIGDSHVWGQGIRNDQRFAKLLETRLNKIRPTKVYTFGKGGSNTLNYLRMYEKVLSAIPYTNLYIILPVVNDALINLNIDSKTITDLDNQNDPLLLNCQKTFSKQKVSIFLDNFKPDDKTSPNKYISDLIESSWQNPINTCVVNESIKRLPDNTIYLIDKDYLRDNLELKKYENLLSQNNKYQISTEVGKFMDKYKKYFKQNVYQNFNVSPSDPHPNTLANQMYTDILFDEITTNPRWAFLENKN